MAEEKEYVDESWREELRKFVNELKRMKPRLYTLEEVQRERQQAREELVTKLLKWCHENQIIYTNTMKKGENYRNYVVRVDKLTEELRRGHLKN